MDGQICHTSGVAAQYGVDLGIFDCVRDHDAVIKGTLISRAGFAKAMDIGADLPASLLVSSKHRISLRISSNVVRIAKMFVVKVLLRAKIKAIAYTSADVLRIRFGIWVLPFVEVNGIWIVWAN